MSFSAAAATLARTTLVLLAALGPVVAASSGRGAGPVDPPRLIVAVHELAEPRPAAGGLPRLRYLGAPQYGGSARAAALAEDVIQTHGLKAEAQWSILPLRVLCLQVRLAPGADAQAMLERLRADPRVALAQPLHEFETLGDGATAGAVAAPSAAALLPGYDDPYAGLQRGFVAIGAPAAQRLSEGLGVRVALVDTGIDRNHPDLAGQIALVRDFVGAAGPAAPREGERHGTEVAGVIAAVAHNRIGIAGVAPRAQLLAYRACWPAATGGARCNSFTLAQALAAAIQDGADILNLSLGGPADTLLERLLVHAQARGIAVVAALPRSGRREGFPAAVPGVLVAGVAEDAVVAGPGVLRAPGRDILTLQPAGAFGYASGPSLAAAHASGALALLRALEPRLAPRDAEAWWVDSNAGAMAALDLCRALKRLRPGHRCG